MKKCNSSKIIFYVIKLGAAKSQNITK